MIEFTAPELPSEMEALRQGTRQIIALIQNQRSLWRVVGRRVARQMFERWKQPPADLEALRASTLDSRDHRYGHYSQPRRFRASASENRTFWWTGKTISYITSDAAFNANRNSLNYNFGRSGRNRLRDLATYMHFGRPQKNRPARPLYNLRQVETEAEKTIGEWLDVVLAGGTALRVQGGGA